MPPRKRARTTASQTTSTINTRSKASGAKPSVTTAPAPPDPALESRIAALETELRTLRKRLEHQDAIAQYCLGQCGLLSCQAGLLSAETAAAMEMLMRRGLVTLGEVADVSVDEVRVLGSEMMEVVRGDEYGALGCE